MTAKQALVNTINDLAKDLSLPHMAVTVMDSDEKLMNMSADLLTIRYDVCASKCEADFSDTFEILEGSMVDIDLDLSDL